MGSRLDELIQRYLEMAEAGEEPDRAALLREAGDDAEALRRWITSHESVARMRKALAGTRDEGEEDVFAHYRELQPIGTGGMATVYRAWDSRLERPVALKILRSDRMPRADSWLHEARALAALDHPNIVRVFEANVYEGQPYLAMEFVDGWSLHSVLATMAGVSDEVQPALYALSEELRPLRARLQLAIDLAEALAVCHEVGTLHRDLKPRNVLVTRAGLPRLVDFGLAHHFRFERHAGDVTQGLFGTPHYMAPEQFRSGQTGESVRTDVYALGVNLYEIFSLLRPVTAFASGGVDLPAGPLTPISGVPLELNQVIAGCMKEDPEERYGSAREVHDDLVRVRERRPVHVQPPALARRARLFVARNRVAFAAAAVALAGTAAFGIPDYLRFEGLRSELRAASPILAGEETELPEDPAALAQLLQEFEAHEPRVERADDAVWASFATPLRESAAPRLEEVARRIRDGIAAEKPRADVLWRASRWLTPASVLAEIPTADGPAAGAVRAEVAGERVFLVHPPRDADGRVQPGTVHLQVWSRQPQLEDPSQMVQGQRGVGPYLFAGLEAPLVLGETPAVAGSELAEALPLAGWLQENVYCRLSLISDDPTGAFFEVEYTLPGGPGPHALRISRSLQYGITEVPAGKVVFTEVVDGPARTYAVSAFQAEREPVNWGRFRKYLDQHIEEDPELKEYRWLLDDHGRDHEPALVPWWVAADYARWQGARLPTFLEAFHMQTVRPEIAKLPPIPADSGSDCVAEGEWVTDLDPMMKNTYRYLPNLEHPKLNWQREHPNQPGRTQRRSESTVYVERIGLAPVRNPGTEVVRVRQGNPYVFRCVRSSLPRLDSEPVADPHGED